jgi:hypothetical protein
MYTGKSLATFSDYTFLILSESFFLQVKAYRLLVSEHLFAGSLDTQMYDLCKNINCISEIDLKLLVIA